ncbi:hypothetical protein OAB57_02740 [Bacteriovoracaceae bacterium]|nr:hypothetical protein [Bacteriovoracaceae bacterium]
MKLKITNKTKGSSVNRTLTIASFFITSIIVFFFTIKEENVQQHMDNGIKYMPTNRTLNFDRDLEKKVTKHNTKKHKKKTEKRLTINHHYGISKIHAQNKVRAYFNKRDISKFARINTKEVKIATHYLNKLKNKKIHVSNKDNTTHFTVLTNLSVATNDEDIGEFVYKKDGWEITNKENNGSFPLVLINERSKDFAIMPGTAVIHYDFIDSIEETLNLMNLIVIHQAEHLNLMYVSLQSSSKYKNVLNILKSIPGVNSVNMEIQEIVSIAQ